MSHPDLVPFRVAGKEALGKELTGAADAAVNGVKSAAAQLVSAETGKKITQAGTRGVG